MTEQVPDSDERNDRIREALAMPVRYADLERDGQRLVGWVRWDGDEFSDFRYAGPGDRAKPVGTFANFMPVYVDDPERWTHDD